MSTAGAGERYEPRVGLLGAGLLSALLFGASALPKLLGEAGSALGLLALAAPFPLMVQRLRAGLSAGLGASALAVAAVSATLGPGAGFTFATALAVPGLLIVESLVRGRGLLKGCGWAFAVLAAEVAVLLAFQGPELARGVTEPLQHYQSAEVLDKLKADGVPPERIEEWVAYFRTLEQALTVVYPAAFLILAGLFVLLNAALLRSWLARRDPGWLDGGEFETLRWPFGLAVAFVAAGALVAWPPARPFAYNVLLLAAFFFTLQGLSVVAFYAQRLAGPPLLRLGLVLLVLLNPWALQILALLGLFDTWFDFRRWAQPPAAQDEP
ncbi:MAG: YybS family protein [Vicinamibacteria bacterium]|nr:YybS family protein [Vicinamibacteria bacterium]